MRDQAAELLELRLWGIGARTPLRATLAAGDHVVVFVGAPESGFIARARVASPVHEWTPDESARYPGDYESGVGLDDVHLWPRPVPLKTVLPNLGLRESNPAARFFAGVIRITREDYETVVRTAEGHVPEAAEGPAAPAGGKEPAPSEDGVNLLFTTTERLRNLLQVGTAQLSEYDTRAVFIDRYIDALGYTEIEDVRRGSPVESGNYPDYVLYVNGEPRIAIEAKKLGLDLGKKEAAQVVQYCSTLGIRWGAVTDGRHFKLYDAPVLGVPPHERLVFEVDLADYEGREDFEARVYPEIALIAKGELQSGAGLERRVAQEAVREVITTAESKTIAALRRELVLKRNLRLSASELSELISELLG